MQKSLIQIVQTVASELNLPSPSVVASSQDQNVLKLLAHVRAVCDDLLAEFDWQQLQTRYTFTTANGQEAYPLPADLERFLNGTFFDQTNRWPLQGPKSPTQWEWLQASVLNGGPFSQFRVYANQFYVTPTPGSTPYTFAFEYLSNYVVRDGNSGATKADFTQDSDLCLFDHRPVVYGVKLKWKESIGQDTTSALADYRRALEFAKGSDGPAPRLSLLGETGLRLLSTDNYPDASWVT